MTDTDTDLAQTLDLAASQAASLLIAWRSQGNQRYSGQGDAFAFGVAEAMFQALVVGRWMARQPADQIEALERAASEDRSGVANLDIAEDEVMMHAVTLALIMIRQRQAHVRGWPPHRFLTIDGIIREAAKLTSVLVGGQMSPYVASVAQQTDEELADAAAKANLFREPAAGRA